MFRLTFKAKKTTIEQNFQDEFGINTKQQYYENGKRYREAQIQRDNQKGNFF